MKTITKKLISVLLCIAMISSMFAFAIPAGAEDIVSGQCGKTLTWTLDRDTGIFAITGEGTMTGYRTPSKVPWNTYTNEITEVVVEYGVTSISQNAFYDCRNLESVSLPETLTKIYGYAFRYCSSLTELTVPASVTSIESSAFEGCDNLTLMVHDGSYACQFAVENALSYKVIGSEKSNQCGDDVYWNLDFTSGTLTISGNGRMYDYDSCYDTPWYEWCGSVRHIVVEEGVTNITNTSCGAVETVSLADSVEEIEYYAFGAFRTLYSINLPDNLQSIGQRSFAHCDSLTNLTIPESVTKIGDEAFEECYNIKLTVCRNSVAHQYAMRQNIPYETIEGVNSDPNIVIGICGETSSWTLELDTGHLTVSGSGAIEGYVGQAEHFCNWAEYIRSVTVGGAISEIYSSAFKNCDKLEWIWLPASVQHIDTGVFDGCNNLALKSYPDTYAHQYALDNGIHFIMTGMAADYGNIYWELDLESGVLTFDGEGDMSDYFDPERVLGAWAYYQDYIKSVYIGDGITGIGKYAFYDCYAIEKIVVSSTVNYIGEGAFMGCTALKSLELPEGITKLNDNLFYNCSSLESVTIPETVTVIGGYAFYGCTSIKELAIPESVSSIWATAFKDYSNLTLKVYEGSYAHQYAINKGIAYEIIGGGSANYEIVEFSAEYVSVWENTQGYWQRYYDENDDMHWWYRYSVSPQSVTVRLSNGEEYTGSLDYISEVLGVSCYMIDDQSYENRFSLGRNAFRICMNIDGEDIYGEFPVYVTETPIESIEVSPMNLYEYSDGSWYSIEDPETGIVNEKAWYGYYLPYNKSEVTITYKDGTVVNDNLYYMINDDYTFIDTYQEYDYQLKLGTNRRMFSYDGFVTYIDINILETPIKSISVDRVVRKEFTRGYYCDVYDENGELTDETWFRYYITPEYITVEFKNGDYYSGDFYPFTWQYNCSYSESDDQSYENPWGIGIHTAEVEIMGKTCVYEVEIIENPIDRVEIEDIYCIENWDGWWTESYDTTTGESHRYWEYDVNPDNMTIYYKDGTQISGDVQYIRNETGFEVGVYILQDYHNQYTLGDYTGKISVEGVEYEYGIHVITSPVESITAEDMELYYEISGWWRWEWDEATQDYTDKWFEYRVEPVFDVVMKNGTVYEDVTTDQIREIFGIEVKSDEDQWNNPWGMGEHKVTMSLLGASCEITVNIVPGGYVTADRMQVIENWDGYITRSEEGVEYWEYRTWPENVTIKLNNGETYTGTTEELEQMLGGYFGVYVSQSPENTWGLGVHTVEFEYTTADGRETYHGSFEVEVVESPIESITASKLVYIANTDGWYESEYDDMTGNYIGEYYRYSTYPHYLTVVLKNGVVYENIEPRELEMIFDRGLQINDDQSCSNQWGVGSHVAYGNFLGCEFEIPVEILATDVSYIRLVSGNQIPECSYVYSSEVEDENGRWYKYDFGSLRFEVGFVDGRIIEGTANELMWNYGYELNINSGETYENRLGIGLHTLEVSLRGKTEEIEIVIVDNGISHFEISDVTYVENQNTYIRGDGDETWYAYDVRPGWITIYLDNGESDTGSMYYIMEQFDCQFVIDTDQSYENQWGVGEHTAYLTLGEEKYPFKVTINEFPIERIEIEDVEAIEKWDGYYRTDCVYDEFGNESTTTWFSYDEEPENVTLYYKDGTVRKVSFMDLRMEFGYDNLSYYFEDMQTYYNQWQIDETYTGTLRFFGMEAQYNVTIVESPVASIDIPEFELIEHWHGNWNSDYINGEYLEYFAYYVNTHECFGDELITVTMKDGTVIQGTYREICELDADGRYLEVALQNQGYNNQCVVGKNKGLLRFFGYEEEIEFEIKENPIESIELEKAPAKSEYTDAEAFDMRGAQFKVTYKDGTVEIFVCDEAWLQNYFEFYSEYMGAYFEFYVYDTIDHGNGEYTGMIKESHTNAILEIDYKLTNFFEEIEAYTGEDGFGYIRYTFTDGSTKEIKLDNIQVGYIDQYEQGTIYAELYCISGGSIFPLMINIDGENRFTCGLYSSLNGEFIESDPVETPLWLARFVEAYESVGKLVLIDNAITSDNFDGEVTKDNIDMLILMAYFSDKTRYDVMNVFYESKDKFVISAEEAEALLADYIGREVDVSISKNYVFENDTVEIPLPENADFRSPGEIKMMISFDGETWSYEDDYKLYNNELGYYEDKSISLTLGNEGILKSYEFVEEAETFEPGDVNEDGKVNVADLFALKVTILTGSADNSAADINGDGKLNINDLFVLKQLIRG